MTGYLAVGYEFAAELTYPEPEVTSSGLLNCSANIFGIILTFGCGKLLDVYGDLVCNGTLSATLLCGAVITFLIRGELKRQKANANSSAGTNKSPVDLLDFCVSVLSKSAQMGNNCFHIEMRIILLYTPIN